MNSKKTVIIFFLFMLFFKNTVSADYSKIFYDFKIDSIEGETINLSSFRDKVVLLVNVASNCGFTKQYSDLQKLWDKYKNSGLVVIGVPSKSFNQEKDTNQEVKEFCEVNFNIDFPLTSIYEVKGKNAHEIYQWAKKNYGNSAIPKWNFHKILIGRDGKIIDTYASFTNPTSNKIVKKIELALN